MAKYESLDAQCFVNRKYRPLFTSDRLPELLYACHVREEISGKHPRIMHSHKDLAEIVLIYQGTGNYMIHNRKYKVKKGDLLIYNAGVVHDENPAPDSHLAFYTLGLGSLQLPGLPENTLVPEECGVQFEAGESYGDMLALFRMIFDNLSEDAPDAERFCNNLLLAVISKILTISEQVSRARKLQKSLRQKKRVNGTKAGHGNSAKRSGTGQSATGGSAPGSSRFAAGSDPAGAVPEDPEAIASSNGHAAGQAPAGQKAFGQAVSGQTVSGPENAGALSSEPAAGGTAAGDPSLTPAASADMAVEDDALFESPGILTDRVMEFIDANYMNPITIQEIADALYASPFYIAHIFKKETGYSPIQYLLRRRIGEAQTLLIRTEIPIVDIAGIVGYETQSYFTSQFTRYVGMPPRQYRIKYRK